MSTERLEILKMLSEGKINPEEAEMLLRALDEPSDAGEGRKIEDSGPEKGRRTFDRFTEVFSEVGREIENEVGKALESVRWQDIGKIVNDAVDQVASPVSDTMAGGGKRNREGHGGDSQEWTFDAAGIARIRAKTVNGSISINADRLVDAAKLSTTNGSIQMNVGEGLGPVTATTNNGAVKLTLPAEFSGRLDAVTGNGRVHADFPVSVGHRSRNRLEGTVGDGGDAVVKLRSMNGSIHLKQRPADRSSADRNTD